MRYTGTKVAILVNVRHRLVVTGGTNAGVMKLVGKVIASSSKTFPLLGFSPWLKVRSREELADNYGDPRPRKYAIGCFSPCELAAELEPHHTHFVLVDKDGRDEWGAEIELRDKVLDLYATL